MIEYLHLENVGPSPELTMELGPRLNLITGDNGLGKSFLLDVAWWALTRKWPAEVNPGVASGLMARPARSGPAAIELSFHSKVKKERYRSEYERRDEAWKGRPGRPPNPGLVLYAQVDGGFSVWDPARNYVKKPKDEERTERQPAYVFSSREVWDGLKRGDTQLCNGLILDWALWQKEGGEAFRQLSEVLTALSPSPEEQLAPGELAKLSIDDARWIPTLKMPYGLDVPVLTASAAMKRVVALAYLLVWSWQEHVRSVALAAEPPSFDGTVRQPGLDAIRELVGETTLTRRRGPKRKKLVDSRDAVPADAFPPFWRLALDDMLGGYRRLCAYTCLYIERVSGGASVDHLFPRSTHWDKVYEWSNYRLACALVNSRKNDAMNVLDPCEIQDGWFQLELCDYQVVCNPRLDPAIRGRVATTIGRLNLNDEECLKARREYAESYKDGEISLDYLERRSPFIARELRRQGKLRKGDVGCTPAA